MTHQTQAPLKVRARSMLCTDAVVRAILEGRRTQDRRPATKWVRRGYEHLGDPLFCTRCGWDVEPEYVPAACCVSSGNPDQWLYRINDEADDRPEAEDATGPHGKPGDLIYVREAFARVPHLPPGDLVGDDHGVPKAIGRPDGSGIAYRASWQGNPSGWKWTPSIHMPKAHARIWLRVTRAWVERVQDITEADARAEGCCHAAPQAFTKAQRRDLEPDEGPGVVGYASGSFARDNFRRLWDSIYADRGDGWNANPYVFCCEFALTEAP